MTRLGVMLRTENKGFNSMWFCEDPGPDPRPGKLYLRLDRLILEIPPP